MALILFVILGFISAAAVIGMIVSKDQTHGALFLVLAFASLGGVFGLLDAPFVAAVQILVYAGAIMVLFLFVLMMINRRENVLPRRKKWFGTAAAILGLLLFVELGAAVMRLVPGPGPEGISSGTVETSRIGELLFGKFLYPFEITSVLIIAAMTGAIALAGKKESR